MENTCEILIAVNFYLLCMKYLKLPAWLPRFLQKAGADARRLLRMKASPEEVTRGVAIGVFIGVFPTFATGLLLTAMIRRFYVFHLPTAILAGTLSIIPPLGQGWILLSAWVGGVDLKMILSIADSSDAFFSASTEIILRYLGGTLIVSIVASLLFAVLTRFVLAHLPQKKTDSPV